MLLELVAQWITRLTTEQKIAGSNPGEVKTFRKMNFPRITCLTERGQAGRQAGRQVVPTKEAIRLSLEEGGAAETGEAGQACLSEFCVMDDQIFSPARPPVDHTGAFSYRLVGVVTHYGGTTRSGHYVSDVYHLRRDRWYHYDDSRVRVVDEADVLGGTPRRTQTQTDGYIFLYLHKDFCR